MIKFKDIILESIVDTVVYHGTDTKFTKFDINKAWDGFWFSDNIDSIKNGESGAAGTKYIMKRRIKLNNPAGWYEYDKYSIGELIRDGYDGVVLPDDDKTDYIVFNPKSIYEV
jgi:hypothetical protein